MNCDAETYFKQMVNGKDASKIVKCNRPFAHEGMHAEKDENNQVAYVWSQTTANLPPAPSSESSGEEK